MRTTQILMISSLSAVALSLLLPSIPSTIQYNNTSPIVISSTAANPALLGDWPKNPWSFTELRDGSIDFKLYGRHLADTAENRNLIDESVSGIYHGLSHSFEPRSRIYTQGVARFQLQLDPIDPPSKSVIMEMFFWLVILVERYRESPTEIDGAILLVHDEFKAYFSLTFPGIAM